jgi:hypothetical protein
MVRALYTLDPSAQCGDVVCWTDRHASATWILRSARTDVLVARPADLTFKLP